MTTTAINVKDLTFAYPDGHQVLFGVNVHIHHGERVALLGPNGAGKTTFVQHLNGIMGAVAGGAGSGIIEIGGQIVTAQNLLEIRRMVGMVFQDPDDQLFMATVADDVAFGPANLKLSKTQIHERVVDALNAVGLTEFADRPPHHLSFGQRRRAAIAGVLAMKPQVLVLDEPSSNLDPAGRRELFDILDGLDVTILMVTHDLPFALQLCERSVIMDDGVVTDDGPTDEILNDSDLLASHRLELPYGFDARSITARIVD